MPEEGKENDTVRDGLFHEFGNILFFEPNENKYHCHTQAIIEDKETGEVLTLHPEFITFKKNGG